MKRFYRILAVAAVIASAVACDPNKYPVFDDSDAFAAFDEPSIKVNEDVGTVSIPVTIASVNPIATTVTYALDAESSTAKEGTNFSFVDKTGVLTFSGSERTKNIEVNIVDLAGEYTGDCSFTIKISSAGSINIGAESSTTVTIQDLDHPLADILGTYTVTATSYYSGSVSYKATFEKDPKDINVVWIVNPLNCGFSIYGNVSEDHKTISIPMPQTDAYGDGTYYYATIYATDDNSAYDDRAVVLTATDKGFTSTDYSFGAYARYVSDDSGAGWFDWLMPPITFTKN